MSAFPKIELPSELAMDGIRRLLPPRCSAPPRDVSNPVREDDPPSDPVVPPYVAQFYLQTVAIAPGGGGGAVTVSPVGNPDNDNPNVRWYRTGTAVTVTAVPDPGSQFAEWLGDASGTVSPVTVTVNSNTDVLGRFELAP